LTIYFSTVKVDEFLQDAEGLAALGLMRSSSQLSFRESGQEDSDYAPDSTSPSSRSRGSSVKASKNKGHEAPVPQQPAQEYQDDSDDEFNNVDEGKLYVTFFSAPSIFTEFQFPFLYHLLNFNFFSWFSFNKHQELLPDFVSLLFFFQILFSLMHE